MKTKKQQNLSFKELNEEIIKFYKDISWIKNL